MKQNKYFSFEGKIIAKIEKFYFMKNR